MERTPPDGVLGQSGQEGECLTAEIKEVLRGAGSKMINTTSAGFGRVLREYIILKCGAILGELVMSHPTKRMSSNNLHILVSKDIALRSQGLAPLISSIISLC